MTITHPTNAVGIERGIQAEYRNVILNGLCGG
jgi:hypothetical protein